MAARTSNRPKTPRTTTKTTTQRPGGGRKATFDFIPGTHIDEYIGPWLVGGILIPGLAYGGWRLWRDDPWPSALATLAVGIFLGAVTWHEARPHSTWFVRWRAAVSVMFVFAACAVTFVVGFRRPWLDIWLWTSVVVAASWNIARTEAVRGSGEQKAAEDDSLSQLVGLPGVSVSDVEPHGDFTTARLHVRGVQGWEDIQKAGIKLRNVTRSIAVRVVPRAGDPQQATVTMVHRDVLAQAIPYPGPASVGTSIAEPIRPGMRADGLPRLFWLTGEGRPGFAERAPFLAGVVGKPGSGKSIFFRDVCAEISGRTDFILWLSDTAKGAQTAKPIAGMVDWLARTAAETQAMLAAVERVAKRRADWLGAHDLEQWEPDCGIPLLIVWFEEAARVADRFAERIIRLSELVRSTGVIIIFSMQRMSGTNMPTDARANLTAAVAFGTDDEVSAGMVLSDATIEAGAKPSDWKSNFPGYHYLEAPGINPGDWAIEGRAFAITREQVAELVAKHAHLRCAALDPSSAEAAGPAYADREDPVVLAGGDQPAPRGTPAWARPQDQTQPLWGREDQQQDREQDQDDDGEDGEGMDADVDEVQDEKEKAMLGEDQELAEQDDEDNPYPGAPEGLDPRTWAGIDPDAPVEPPADYQDVELDDGMTPGRRLDMDEQAEKIREILAGLLEGYPQGRDVDTSSLVDAWMAIPGMPARPALYRWLNRYARRGLAESRERGLWHLHPGAAAVTVTVGDDEDDED